ncbi:MAG: UDP-N-acetylmuramoyl-L-alanine--D-glutamate ligase [bacterium]
MMKIRDKTETFPDGNVLIVGLAKTGLAAARFLASQGCRVTISEQHNITEVKDAFQELSNLDIQWEFGGHQEKTFLDKDWILVSPGVPMNIVPLLKARSNGIPILSDIELAYRLTDSPIIAITGTNGKTTTTTLLGQILNTDGKRVFVGGNIGTPILNALDNDIDYDFLVVEVSSFQLEGVVSFAPYMAIILNITPDHLDRYSDITEYQEAKARILKLQKSNDYAILNARDPWVYGLAKRCSSQVFLFDYGKPVSKGANVEAGHIIIHDQKNQIDLGAVEEMGLTGNHNMENIMAASIAAYLAGASQESIRTTLREFRGLPHRLEKVRNIRGVDFVNDSKGTNVGAVIKAIESVNDPIILIAGGKDKGGDFSTLSQLVQEKVRAIFLIGEATEKIAGVLGAYTKIIKSDNLQSAVRDAYRMARSGYTILFSPGCASFDMFKDYKDRGEKFKQIVEGLENA